jgi:3-oxoacyl-[acyl-carrier protein] reductase
MTAAGRLGGRRALITGGSRGIGAAIVRAFAAEGCDVAFCYVSDVSRARAVVADVTDRGRVAYAIQCDLADPGAVKTFVGEAAEALGQIDIVVNNAGISGETPFEDITMEVFDRMIAVHLRGTFLVSQLCYPAMRQRGFGRIINVSSQLAYKGAPGLAHYCAANAGIIGFTRALAHEGAPHGVLVNAIAPGPVDTDLMAYLSEDWKTFKRTQLPLGRFGLAEEIAPTAVMLASDDGAFYVGQTLSPNGGDVML